MVRKALGILQLHVKRDETSYNLKQRLRMHFQRISLQTNGIHIPRQLRKSCFLALTLLILTATALGCKTTQTADEATGDEPPIHEAPPNAPWHTDVLSADAIPSVYLDQWQEAENREHCALIAPISSGPGEGLDATARSAYFGGGWGIAYDLPGLRSAFGVAGTGAEAADPSYDQWPFNRTWPDGSTVGYGPEGGSGPNQLAYLRIAGQDCLYNVWSRLGVDHLEGLLEQLRFVEP